MLRKLPLIVILGSTATGKTKLSIELAQRFRGEIISADSMQIYKGLDISTAKATRVEQAQAVHHLLDVRDACSNLIQPYTVVDFRDSALPIIDRLLGDEKIPIIVGGTNYYIESVLWKVLVKPPLSSKRKGEDAETSASKRTKDELIDAETALQLNELTEEDLVQKTPEYLHDMLVRVDPMSAQRLHPNDTRKVRRALEVYMETGQRMSDVHAKQREEEGSSYLGGPLRYDNIVLFWIKSDQEMLNERIDKRIDGMVAEGLLAEIRLFYNNLKAAYAETAGGAEAPTLDCTKGMMQAIGFKEFVAYLEKYPDAANDEEITEFMRTHSDGPKPEGLDLLEECLDLLRLRTKRYSKKQIKWVNLRFVSTKGRHVPPIYVLDSTHAADRWTEDVFQPAEKVIQAYLDGTESEVQPIETKEHRTASLNDNVTHFCVQCDRRFIGDSQLDLHLKSNVHKRKLASLKKQEELKKRNELLDQIKIDD